MKALLILAIALAISPLQGAELIWETDWDAAFARAKAEGKPVFVDFWASWCGPCRRMEAQTFASPEVRMRLQRYVLLKIDVDRSSLDEQYRVRAFPTYSIRDPWERQLFQYRGYCDWRVFSARLDTVERGLADLLEATAQLREKETVSAFMLLGRAFLKAEAVPDARKAYEAASEIARRDGDAEQAQVAEIEAALTWNLERQPKRALKLLQKLSETPATPRSESATWLAIGHTKKLRGDTRGARAAYERALALVGNEQGLRQQIEHGLASLAR